ncbi:retrovirus-related pol polyprotein from transposon TNT 1-94 [Tanacetum coccineum]|uniref:Retrovirus-related pol polyprotein from transposon TNT 1-94 n=1 Tax=Tanacetum coccineum TaxID=301880 RepID=A0ABQ5CWS9_9ASTR
MVFNGSLMYKDTFKGAGAADSRKEVEFEVELQGSRVEPIVDSHTAENPGNEDEEQDEEPQQQNLENYVLENTLNQSLSRRRLIHSQKDEWVRAMEKEMNSLKKKHTWELGHINKPGQKLKKSLYGLKQSPRQWYKRFDVDIISNGFSRNRYDSCVYFKEFAPCLVYGRNQGKHVYVDSFLNADYAKDPDKEAEYMTLTEAVKESIWLKDYAKDPDKEAEYMALTGAVKESIWLKGLLIELEVNLRSVVVNCDNQIVIRFSGNAMFPERTKHINVRYHFIREIDNIK